MLDPGPATVTLNSSLPPVTPVTPRAADSSHVSISPSEAVVPPLGSCRLAVAITAPDTPGHLYSRVMVHVEHGAPIPIEVRRGTVLPSLHLTWNSSAPATCTCT